jgi:hypothetical protein
MNLERLKQAEAAFLNRFPGGFNNPEIKAVRERKHNVDKMIAFAQESFAESRFRHPDRVVDSLVKVVSRSSVISVFEKARFKDFVFSLSIEDQNWLAECLENLLHKTERSGFEAIRNLLQSGRLAKWSLMTVCQTYYHPQRDVLIKPMTVKGIIQYFELTRLQYKPTPTWEFYDAYRSTIHEMKSSVAPSLSPTNAAFSWFLLLSFHNQVFDARPRRQL